MTTVFHLLQLQQISPLICHSLTAAPPNHQSSNAKNQQKHSRHWDAGPPPLVSKTRNYRRLPPLFKTLPRILKQPRCHNSKGVYSYQFTCTPNYAIFSLQPQGYGFPATLYLLRAIFRYYHILLPSVPTIQAHIDNQALINRLSHGPDTAIKYLHLTDSNLIREIHSVLETLPFTIQRLHVKSHQYDQVNDPEDIPINHC